jgi:hypothetical protein
MPANILFGINPDPQDPDNPKFDVMDFGDSEISKEDWSRAKNTVRWRPGV